MTSFGDILACCIGYVLARCLGMRRALAVFVLTEAVLVVWTRYSLLLNVIMLLYPIDAIKEWQAAGR